MIKMEISYPFSSADKRAIFKGQGMLNHDIYDDINQMASCLSPTERKRIHILATNYFLTIKPINKYPKGDKV